MSTLLGASMRSGGGGFDKAGSSNVRVLSFNELMAKNEWVPANGRERCVVCALRFSTFRRKSHCRMCGEVVCGNCIVKKDALLPILGISKVKICKPCAVTISDDAHDRKTPRSSDIALTVKSSLDMEVTQKDLDDLEALFSPSRAKFDNLGFTGWNVVDLNVPWIPVAELKDVRQLSSDEHANVWLVNYQESQLLVAKRLAKENRTDLSAADFLNDIKHVSKLQHPRIVELVGTSWTADRDFQALFEYLPGGDLRAYLDSTAADAIANQQRKIEKLRIALDIAEALAYVHSLEQPFHHRALESRNVLLTASNRAKIGGFGAVRVELATTAGPGSSEVARWLAPQVISDSRAYDSSCDIYSLGVILTELDTHMIPFSDCHGPQGNVLPTVAILFLISLGQAKPSMSASCPPEIRQLANDCLSFDSDKRPTAIEVVAWLRRFIRTLGLEKALEAGKTPQQQHQGILLCEGVFV